MASEISDDTHGTLAHAFRGAGADKTHLLTAEKLLGQCETYLSRFDKPIPAHEVLGIMGKALSGLSSQSGVIDSKAIEPLANEATKLFLPYLLDGQLDRNELVHVIADVSKASRLTPPPSIVNSASGMLTRLGITDNSSKDLATGIAKTAVMGIFGLADADALPKSTITKLQPQPQR